MNVYTFHRKEGWYPIELVNDVEAAHHVLFNPGTVKVVNEISGKIVFESGAEPPDSRPIDQKHVIP